MTDAVDELKLRPFLLFFSFTDTESSFIAVKLHR